MSGQQSSLLLRKGAVGQAYWPLSRTWHDVKIDKHPTSLDAIQVHWHKQKGGARSVVEQDMLRCVNLGGSDEIIYRGMITMCRDNRVDSDVVDLPGYRFGTVTAIINDPSVGAAGRREDVGKNMQIEFEFETNSAEGDNGHGLSSRIKAVGSDLLYWAVPFLAATDAKSQMGMTDADSGEDEGEDETSDVDDDDLLPPRKRQAPTKLDPSSYTKSPAIRRVIHDDESSDEDLFDKELFPDSDGNDDEGEGGASADAGVSTGSSSWGTPSVPRESSWGVAMSPEANDSSNGWGASATAVTPDTSNGRGWGRYSYSAGSSGRGGWGWTDPNESNSWNAASSSGLQYRTMPESRSTTIQSKHLTQSDGTLEVIRETEDDFFLRWHFGSDRVKIVEVGLNQITTIEKAKTFGDELHTLVVAKYEQGTDDHTFRSRLSKFGGTPFAKSYYVKGNFRSVQKELSNLANFSELALTPGKLASRLELLVSTAAVHSVGGEKIPYMFQLPASCFEEIDGPENQTMGCGFIPSHMLEDLLGNNNDAKDALAVQCRIVCPSLGIFKGMLLKKAGIEKIQLPSSMKKVGKSSSRKKGFRGGFILINSGGICPSKPTRQMERAMNPQSPKKPTKTSEKELRGIDNMMKRLMLGCGASPETLDRYNELACTFVGRKHAYLTGVCDCTDGGLPPGTIFLTGFGVGGEVERNVFVTRSPCTERLDAAILKVVSQKPSGMTDENWKHLCGLPFGSIMFASPSDADAKSLPERINNSDLDGDRFFCLWEPTLMPELERELGVGIGDCGGDGDDGDDDRSNVGQDPPESEFPETDNSVGGGGVGDQTSIMVEDVLSHRGKGRNAEVEVLSENGKRSWVGFYLVKDQMPELLAEYALQKNLLDEKGWGWAKEYIRDAEIVKVVSHRFQGGTCQVECLYDGDPKTTWTVAASVDTDILATYIEDKGISLQRQEWQWLAKRLKKEKTLWFKTVQARVANIKHLSENNRFVTKLFGLHGKHAKLKGIDDADSISFGRAYKAALDVCKHGGRVSLPRHLREEVAGKKAMSFTQFLKDA